MGVSSPGRWIPGGEGLGGRAAHPASWQGLAQQGRAPLLGDGASTDESQPRRSDTATPELLPGPCGSKWGEDSGSA